jgi:hypothetical protein
LIRKKSFPAGKDFFRSFQKNDMMVAVCEEGDSYMTALDVEKELIDT